MIRVVLAAALLLTVAVGPSHAGDCDQYRFGSQDWWECKNQYGGPN